MVSFFLERQQVLKLSPHCVQSRERVPQCNCSATSLPLFCREAIGTVTKLSYISVETSKSIKFECSRGDIGSGVNDDDDDDDN
jgi:hypothetical protein